MLPRALAHQRQHRAADIEAAHGTIELCLIVRPLQIVKPAAPLGIEGIGPEGIVDHDVDAPRFAHYAVHHALHRLWRAHIGLDRPGIAARVLACGQAGIHSAGCSLVIGEVVDGHRRALARKRQGNRRANATAGSRHQHHLAAQAH